MCTIDQLYESAIAKLTNQNKIIPLSQHLQSLKSNNERTLYLEGILKELNLLPKLITVKKNDNVSIFYRNQGNKYFEKSDNYKAWQYYNLSLMHAPLNSDSHCLAVANRSAVLFSIEKYKECLEEIRTVFSMKYPRRLQAKLSKRKTLCENYIDEKDVDNSPDEYYKLTGLRNSRYPCASAKLDVVYTKEMGRHVIAKEDIDVGEVLAVEEPYFTLLLKSQYLFCCSYCISMKASLLPCENCCFALYCSKECKDKAFNEFHKYECSLMPTLIRMEFTKLELLALRTVIKSRTDHASWDDLFKTIEIAESNINTEFHGLIKVDNEWVYDSKYYAAIHTLESNIHKRNISDVFQKSVTAAVFLYFLSYTGFLDAENDEQKCKIRDCVAKNLLHHEMTSPTNFHNIGSNVQTKKGDFVDEIGFGSAPYAFHSLLNHSCVPNVVHFTKLGTGSKSLFALRPIKKGMQVFDNYGAHHAISSRLERQSELIYQYKFACKCEACLENWPMYPQLSSVCNLAMTYKKESVLTPDVLNNLQKGSIDEAKSVYKSLCELMQSLDKCAPCIELADCQEALKQCLIIFGGLVPYGYSQTIEWNAIPPKV